jgi:hypothetical protein
MTEAASQSQFQPQYVQAVGLGLEAETTACGVRTLTYSWVGLEPGVALVLLR